MQNAEKSHRKKNNTEELQKTTMCFVELVSVLALPRMM